MGDLEAEWASFCMTGSCEFAVQDASTYMEEPKERTQAKHVLPGLSNSKDLSTPLYISTTTKISFLNKPIFLNDVFWRIPVMSYYVPEEGVIKKQMKVNSTCEEQLNNTLEKLDKMGGHIQHHIITRVVNPDGRVKYKDIRKISVGLCKKDIQSHRSREKSAFYNCFVMILRIRDDDNSFKEIHVKVFNTGKLEIPGIQSALMLEKTLGLTKQILKGVIDSGESDSLDYMGEPETVLINSNFNCGFHIDRQKLYNLIKNEYRLCCNFDPCSYPGVQCKYFFSDDSDSQLAGRRDNNNNDQYKISFMVFRTGSVLIVGKCTERVLHCVFQKIKQMLIANKSVILDYSTPISPEKEEKDVDINDDTEQSVTASKKRLRRFIKVTASY